MSATLLTRPAEAIGGALGRPVQAPADTLAHWLKSQRVNAARAALLLRPFRNDEFGEGSQAPSPAHIAAVNEMMGRLRGLVGDAAAVQAAASRTADGLRNRAALAEATTAKEAVDLAVAATEKLWQFYWDIFGQRQTRIAPALLAADRVALDCYQYTYGGLGKARSIPSPAPLAYMESGTGPATFRRAVVLSRLGRLPNPFPLVKLPYHRLVCPWTLGAIPHEVGHNLQSDLGLWWAIPRALYHELRRDGVEPGAAIVWTRWHKEIFADLIGVLLIGPAFVGSLMDVVGKTARAVFHFTPRAVHPVAYLRVLINLELLGRVGFARDAAAYGRAWAALYPAAGVSALPQALRRTAEAAIVRTVRLIAFTPYPQLGGKTLGEVVAFRPQDQTVAIEAAQRLARGQDPGIVPERFMIAAARYAMDHELAEPATIHRHFYDALGRR